MARSFCSRRRSDLLRILVQLIGVLALLLGLTLLTLRLVYKDADGPSRLFPGGALVTGAMHTGPEPDWSFIGDVFTIELQLENPLGSRRIFVMETDNKLYVPSGYMRSTLGRLWKDWAFKAEEGDGLAVARINGVRYERKLVRVNDPTVVAAVAQVSTQKYGGGATPEAITRSIAAVENGDTWIFELAPRGNNQ